MVKPPERRLCDWHPSWGPEEMWLAQWAEARLGAGVLPPYEGAWCTVNDLQRKRWAMVTGSLAQDRRPPPRREAPQ